MRGMYGRSCAHVKDLLNHFTAEHFGNGWVDFVLGASSRTPAPS